MAYRRWKDRRARGCTRGELNAFHADHELQILSHSPRHGLLLKRLATAGRGDSTVRLADRYGELFMAALRVPATVQGHLRVLRRISDELGGKLTPLERRKIRQALDRYRRGLVGRGNPLTLLRRHVVRQDVRALRNQVYLFPD